MIVPRIITIDIYIQSGILRNGKCSIFKFFNFLMIVFDFHEYDLTRLPFHVFRPYLSMIDPTQDTLYTSSIEDGGDNPRVSVYRGYYFFLIM
jgi:hypothetical protein